MTDGAEQRCELPGGVRGFGSRLALESGRAGGAGALLLERALAAGPCAGVRMSCSSPWGRELLKDGLYDPHTTIFVKENFIPGMFSSKKSTFISLCLI